jgi:hypothetical protein
VLPFLVLVDGGYYENGLSGSGDIYVVMPSLEGWTVVKDIMLWIS